MTTIALQRLARTDYATYGQLIDAEQKVLAVTLELPWRNNQRMISCIPAGTYVAHRFPSPKRGYDVFKLDGVPDRDDIEIHIGNLPHDTDGCILVGSNLGVVNGQHGVTGSAAAFARFMDGLKGVDTFSLVVSDPSPGVLA